MKKSFAPLAFCLLALSVALPSTASELIIPGGKTYTVTADNMSMNVDKLVIGDKASIRFAEGVTHWELLAKDATVGHGVVIHAAGSAGSDGAAGQSYEEPADACRSGKSGTSGEAGAPGGRGLDIYLGLDARKIGGLQVIADGGDGGNGGAGGQGQKAGRILNCNPVTGGNGGSGGTGGVGGDGGNVVVSVSTLDGDKDIGALIAGVRVSVKPGKGGKGGESGEGGEGSDGQYINAKTLAGTQKWVSGGRSGRSGAAGDGGEAGNYGQLFVGGQFTGFQPMNTRQGGFDGFDNFRPAATTSNNNDAAEKEIQLLREQLKTLQDRMEKLEKE
ncbi:MAG: hypothetical protein VR73_02250 [Gammaproteobacteria bacterium BRH_c0]|nr:MAG: hypothetical protein VR73_02250 [Gammaproteobacteria bacterium BRH_c0]